MSSPLVSVIILNYNGRTFLGKILEGCIESVLKTDFSEFEVLFVDNASTDDSVRFACKRFGDDKRFHIIRNKQNFGFAEGNNWGIKQSKGTYIVLLNTDTIVRPEWLSELVDAVQPAYVGAAQANLILMDGEDELDCAGGLVDSYGYHLERGKGEKSSSYNYSARIFYAKGAAAVFKREVLEKTGLFDPDIFMYFDEVDLCWRVHLAGYQVVYAPKSVVYHFAGSTALKMQSKERIYLYTRNHMLILLKNFGLAKVFKAVVVSVLFEARNAALFLARQHPLASLAIVKALFWNLRNLKRTWAKRRAIQINIRRVPDDHIAGQMLTPYPPFPLYLVFSRYRYIMKGRGLKKPAKRRPGTIGCFSHNS